MGPLLPEKVTGDYNIGLKTCNAQCLAFTNLKSLDYNFLTVITWEKYTFKSAFALFRAANSSSRISGSIP